MEFAVLTRPNGADVGGQAGVEDDVVFAGMALHWKAADYLEAVAMVQLSRDGAEYAVQLGQWERLLVDVAQRLAES